MVHDSFGPVAGSLSQNSVSRTSPPGWLKQQVSPGFSVLQLSSLSAGHSFGPARAPAKNSARAPSLTADMVVGFREDVKT